MHIIAYIDNEGNEACFRGEVEGIVSTVAKGENGFGYDPIFLLPELNKTFAELTMDEKNSYSHRNNSLAKFREYLTNNKLI